MKTSLRTWCGGLAILGGVGRLPLVPGTWATYFTLPFVYLASLLPLSLYVQLIILACITLVSYCVIWYALPLFNSEIDPSVIVLDEFVGTLVTFVGVPFSWTTLGLGFLLFRFFDILKPLGIKRIERVGGAFGIMADDIVAGIYANIILQIYVLLFV